MEKEVIVIKQKLEDPKGLMIPKKMKFDTIIKIADEEDQAIAILKINGRFGVAAWNFLNVLAEDLGNFEKDQEGVVIKDQYCLVMKYPGKKKEAVRDLILDQLKTLNENVRR